MTSSAAIAAAGAVTAVLASGLALLGASARAGGRRIVGRAGAVGAPNAPCPAWVEEACRQLRWSGDPDRAWARLRVLPVAAFGAGLVLAGPVAAVAVAVACFAAPRLLRPGLARRRLVERDAQLPAVVERIASALRAGARPGPAIVEVADSTAGPLGDELRQVAGDLEGGEALTVTLDRWADRPETSADVALTAAALALGAQAGGQVARAVDGVAATLRERREVQAEVRALATQARSSAWLLAAAPIAFAALVATVEPGAVRFLLTTPIGLICLTAGLTLDALGVWWMARIVRSAA